MNATVYQGSLAGNYLQQTCVLLDVSRVAVPSNPDAKGGRGGNTVCHKNRNCEDMQHDQSLHNRIRAFWVFCLKKNILFFACLLKSTIANGKKILKILGKTFEKDVLSKVMKLC